MKPTSKIAVLLGAVVMITSLSVWLWHSAPAPHNAAATPPPASPTNTLATTNPSTIATPGLATAAPDPVPESVRPIVAVAPAPPFAERVRLVRALPADLTADETHAFYSYLVAPARSGAENRQQENWLRNSMMDKLVELTTGPAELAGMLVSIYQDPTQDIVMRDYAVQHMMPAYARASPGERATLRQTLWQAVEETDSSIAGTALLVLRDLAQDHSEFEPNKLGEVALKLAGDDRCGELSRITAIQICGRMGINQAAPLMQQLVQNAGSVPLQIAAIAALGDVGKEEAWNFLRQLAAQPEPRLLPALETALKKLNGRRGI